MGNQQQIPTPFQDARAWLLRLLQIVQNFERAARAQSRPFKAELAELSNHSRQGTCRNQIDSPLDPPLFFKQLSLFRSQAPVDILAALQKAKAGIDAMINIPEPVSPIENIELADKAQMARAIKTLMAQVRLAIRTLATSIYLENPNQAPIQEVLRQVKPHLDRLVQIAERQDNHPSSAERFYRRPLPRSFRSLLAQKNMASPKR